MRAPIPGVSRARSGLARRRPVLALAAAMCAGIVFAGVGSGPALGDEGRGKSNDKAKKSNGQGDRSRSDGNSSEGDDDNGGNDGKGRNDETNRDANRGDDGNGKGRNGCRSDWPAASSGRPQTLREGAPLGAYVWQDSGQWRVVVTHPGSDTVSFQGTVAFDAAVSAKKFQLEKGSDSFVTAGNQVAFTFRNSGHLDGIKLRSDCATSITVAISVNGRTLAPNEIFIGRNAAPAPSVPFALTRTIPPSTTRPLVTTPPTPTVPRTVPTAADPSCPQVPAWSTLYQGRPSNLRAGASAGLYVWFDGDRFVLETTRPAGATSTISGTVTANAPVVEVRGRSLDPSSDVLNQQSDGASFSFATNGGIDGLDLRAPCATRITVTASIDGQTVQPLQVWVGRTAAQPGAVPVVFAR